MKGFDLARPSGKTDRLHALKKLCEAGQIFHITQAARQLGTSEATLRRDLAQMDANIMCLGGYVMQAGESAEGYSLSRAQNQAADVKAQLAHEAATLVAPEDVLFIDCGSTLVHMVAHLPTHQGVTVVTHALNIAEHVAQRDGLRLILLAGLYHPETGSFSSEQALETLENMAITKGFFSAAGVDPIAGVSSFHFHEQATKRMAMRRSRQRYLVCDLSKRDKIRPAIFAQIDDFDRWIC